MNGSFILYFYVYMKTENGVVTQDLIDKAIQTIIEHKKISPTMLQRKFALSYNLSAQIMWKLEDMGIVGPQDGAKPRVIYFDKIPQGSN